MHRRLVVEVALHAPGLVEDLAPLGPRVEQHPDLAEIQAACDRLIIINRGSLVFEGPTHELLDQARNELVIVPEYRSDLSKLAALLDEKGINFAANGVGLRAPGATAESALVNRLAFEHGVTLRELRADVEDLEDVFLRLTKTREIN